jgi:hypothetical protein
MSVAKTGREAGKEKAHVSRQMWSIPFHYCVVHIYMRSPRVSQKCKMQVYWKKAKRINSPRIPQYSDWAGCEVPTSENTPKSESYFKRDGEPVRLSLCLAVAICSSYPSNEKRAGSNWRGQ